MAFKKKMLQLSATKANGLAAGFRSILTQRTWRLTYMRFSIQSVHHYIYVDYMFAVTLYFAATVNKIEVSVKKPCLMLHGSGMLYLGVEA